MYHSERYKPEHPPLMIYLPSVDLLEKMIRATARGQLGRPISNFEDILEQFLSVNVEKKKDNKKRKN